VHRRDHGRPSSERADGILQADVHPIRRANPRPSSPHPLSAARLTASQGHANPTTHYPELVLNNFATRLGHAVGRMFQTLFPPLPEFQGRQVVTLHNQRDFLFLRRHRYAFRSADKVALQEIGPRLTLKLRALKRGLPAVANLGAPARPLEFDDGADEEAGEGEDAPRLDGEGAMPGAEPDADADADSAPAPPRQKRAPAPPAGPPKTNEYEWQWKPELETSRRTFFL
jgi:ribosome production factor 1